MEEITKLDMTRYLVLKQEDIDKKLSPRQKVLLESMKRIIGQERMKKGKPYSSSYLVLNLDDKIDMSLIMSKLDEKYTFLDLSQWNVKVKDIAVDLVNAILKAKEGGKNE